MLISRGGLRYADPQLFLSISSKLKFNSQVMKTDLKNGHILFYLKNVSSITIGYFFFHDFVSEFCFVALSSEGCLKASIYYGHVGKTLLF